jgi:DinB family protein
MHPRIAELVEALDGRRAELTRAVSQVPTVARNRRPAKDRWSVAEVLEHLALVEENVGNQVRRVVAAQRVHGLGAEHDSTSMAQTFNTAFVLDRSQKRVARDAMQPRGGIDAAAAWMRLERARQVTRDTLRELDGIALCDVSAPHPALARLMAISGSCSSPPTKDGIPLKYRKSRRRWCDGIDGETRSPRITPRRPTNRVGRDGLDQPGYRSRRPYRRRS